MELLHHDPSSLRGGDKSLQPEAQDGVLMVTSKQISKSEGPPQTKAPLPFYLCTPQLL